MSDDQTEAVKAANIQLAKERSASGGLPARQRPITRMVRSLVNKRLALTGAIIIVVVLLVAMFANFLTPYDPGEIDILYRLKPPGWRSPDGALHPLGTDTLGRDVYTRLIYGARVSLAVGLTVVLIAGTIGVFLGLIAGYLGGPLDDFIMRIADIQLAFPFILLAISVIAIVGPGVAILVVVLGISRWMEYARIVRSQTISLRENEFVTASRSIGSHNVRIISRHILPNVWGAVIVISSFSVASTIIAEASLSYLGLGVPPEVPSWGGMLADSREYLQTAPWLSIFPGLAIALTVLGVNVVGDWLRDYLDPSLKNLAEK